MGNLQPMPQVDTDHGDADHDDANLDHQDPDHHHEQRDDRSNYGG